MASEEQNKVAMVFMAHPDDGEFGSAGTTAVWVNEGWEVYYVICTDATGGGDDLATVLSVDARRATSEMRKREQRAAGAILGLKDVLFLDYPDGLLEPTLRLRRDIVRLLRTYRPTRVICPSPDRVWSPSYYIGRHHPDHLACGEAVMAAVYPASQNAWDFPELLAEGLSPHKVSEVYVVGAPVNNHYVDISSTIDTKIAALRAHESQVGSHFDEVEKWMREGAARSGEAENIPFAERFHRIEND
jgi:LmbE family N-acetylglucosaminyl deacetylase